MSLEVRWHYKTVLSISHVVPHPHDDSFVVFLTHVPNQKAKTRALIFGTTSSSPSSVHSLPFCLRNLSLYTRSRVLPTYTFVGITQDWNVVLFGDEARLIEEGSTAKDIAPVSVPSSRSLFQDIFGKSAFAGLQSVQALPTESPTRSWTGKVAFDAFDSPTYLMLPLGNVYDSIMEGFLKRRPEAARDGSIGPGDEDVEMDEDEVAMVADIRRPRIVSREEVDIFVELFRKHSIQCMSISYS